MNNITEKEIKEAGAVFWVRTPVALIMKKTIFIALFEIFSP